MDLAHISGVPRHINSLPNVIIGIRNIHLPHHPEIGTGDAHPGLFGHFGHPGVDVQGFIQTIQGINPQCSCKIFGMEPHNH